MSRQKYTLLFFYFTSSIGLFCYPMNMWAQKQASIWYFGQYAGLDFTIGSPIALTDGMLEIRGGSSSSADEHGRLLFYTDGWNVWNRNHERMPGNGDRLNGGGDMSTSSGYIVPMPGSRTKYYIFTTDAPPPFGTHGLQYSVIDMEAQGGLGDVAIKNIPLLSDSICTKIAATFHSNRKDIWVVTQKLDTNALYAFLVTDTGVVHEPVISYTGVSPKSSWSTAYGQIKFSPDGTKLATAIPHPIDRFEVVEFDKTTGRFASPVVSSSIASYIGTFGIEFSPDSKKLYVSRVEIGKGRLLQYNLSIFKASEIFASEYIVLVDKHFESLQLAPDGKIYVCHGENEKYISSIDNPNAKGKDCRYSH